MAKEKTTVTPEIDEIREDIEALKTNVVELTRHVQERGIHKTAELAQMARERLDDLQNKGKSELKKVERQVKAKPAQSLAVAFGAGLLAHLLLGRRG